MAEGGSISDAGCLRLKSIIENYITCSICMDTCSQPKVLQCQHVFCLECLENWMTQQRFTTSIECPECRQRMALRRPGAESLPAAFHAQEIIEELLYGAREPLQPLNQTELLPDRPRLVKQIDFSPYGAIAFDPEGKLLCIREDSTAELIDPTNGSAIRAFTTNIPNTCTISSIAFSNTQLAVILRQDSNTGTLTLFERNINDISFNGGRILNLNNPFKCTFTSDQCLIVCEVNPSTVAMFDQRLNLIRTINLNFRPYYLAADDNDSFYVCDTFNDNIRHYQCHGRHGTVPGLFTDTVLRCEDRNGNSFYPYGIAIDKKNRRLFVCDWTGNRILQLSGDRFVEWLKTETDEISSPWNIDVNGSGQLVVHGNNQSKLYLYDML